MWKYCSNEEPQLFRKVCEMDLLQKKSVPSVYLQPVGWLFSVSNITSGFLLYSLNFDKHQVSCSESVWLVNHPTWVPPKISAVRLSTALFLANSVLGRLIQSWRLGFQFETITKVGTISVASKWFIYTYMAQIFHPMIQLELGDKISWFQSIETSNRTFIYLQKL